MIAALATQTWVHVAAGAMLMGSWALFANWDHATGTAMQAAAVQAVLSGVLTLCLKTVADRVAEILPQWWQAAGCALIFSSSLLIGAHLIAGTPELALTITVPLLVSGTYIFGYCYLRRGLANDRP